jgi:hypothetical protein
MERGIELPVATCRPPSSEGCGRCRSHRATTRWSIRRGQAKTIPWRADVSAIGPGVQALCFRRSWRNSRTPVFPSSPQPEPETVVFALLFVLLTLLILTAAIGWALNLPSLSMLRCRLAERKMRPLALLVAAAPALSALFDLPGRLAAALPMRIAFAEEISQFGGIFLSTALAGCWLAIDEGSDGRVIPYQAFCMSFVLFAIYGILVPTVCSLKN